MYSHHLRMSHATTGKDTTNNIGNHFSSKMETSLRPLHAVVHATPPTDIGCDIARTISWETRQVALKDCSKERCRMTAPRQMFAQPMQLIRNN